MTAADDAAAAKAAAEKEAADKAAAEKAASDAKTAADAAHRAAGTPVQIASTQKLDKTIRGGHYINAQGKHVNAHGQEINPKTGEVIDGTPTPVQEPPR